MFPELVTRPDLTVFLPPIGGLTVYIVGSVAAITDPAPPLAVRVHDECNGSDVFSSDICTCRPYLVHGVQVCLQTAVQGGVGGVVYCRKEGRALGEVTKFLVYNARKRQAGGDRAESYFARTECVAGVQDMRFQELIPDVLHWLGITKIDRFVSMSDMKYKAIVDSGIQVARRIPLPDDRIPPEAYVEINAKKAAGYYTEGPVPDALELAKPLGRGLEAEPGRQEPGRTLAMAENVIVIDHPLVQHKLTLLRKAETSAAEFRALLREISMLLAYEVTRDMPLTYMPITTPLAPMQAPVLAGKKLVVVSIMRAGNGIL